MVIEQINPARSDVKRLIQEADSLMLAMYPPESNHLDDVSELSGSNVCFTGAFIQDQLAAIGAVKIMNNDGMYGEIKRVYVDTQYRGQNLAAAVMQYLEQYLISQGVLIARLETGDKQIAAIGLYEKLGYSIRDPYGSYIEDPLSIFMEKKLC